jgi:hypothetical protein
VRIVSTGRRGLRGRSVHSPHVDSRTFWKALVAQGLAVAVLAAVLALLLSDDFFEDYGWISGPLAWLACSLLTARLLALPISIALFSAAAGGIAGAIVFVVASHWPGVVAGLLVFAASCASYDAGAEPATQ